LGGGREDNPGFSIRQIISTIYYPRTIWQSLVEIRLLISVCDCEAWQWSRMQNLRRVGK